MRTASSSKRPQSMRLSLPSLALLGLVAACGGDEFPLVPVCQGRAASVEVRATIDTVLRHASETLRGEQGTSFDVELELKPAPASGPAAGTGLNPCDGKLGEGRFKGDLPDPVRTTVDRQGRLTWRIEGEIMIVDMNPDARDNNLVLILHTDGAEGQLGMSGFAGETARGRASVR
jgi:hypothetical protein